MAEPTQSSMIDRLKGFVPSAVSNAIDPVGAFREMLRRYYVGNQPATPTAPAAPPAPTEGSPSPSQGPRRPSTPAVVTPTAAAAPAPAQADQSQPSLLASLREAVAQDVAPLSSSERMGAFGRGVLSGRGSFLDNLSAGLAAQNQAEAARRAEVRQSIETQARLAEQERKGQLEKAKFAEETSPESLTGRLRESMIDQNRAQAEWLRRRQSGGNTSLAELRLQITDERSALATALRLIQNNPRYISLTPEQQLEEARKLAPSLLSEALAERTGRAPQAPAAAPTVPTIDPARRPAQ